MMMMCVRDGEKNSAYSVVSLALAQFVRDFSKISSTKMNYLGRGVCVCVCGKVENVKFTYLTVACIG